jgi:hypothetical protein
MSDKILYETEAKAVQRDPRANVRATAPREAIAPTSGERLHRRRRNSNPFEIGNLAPPGFTYEWKREEVYGQKDTTHWIEMRENHWRPVPAARHPELAVGGDTIIKRGGTILCERPKYLTEEAQMEQLQDALDPVQNMQEIMYGSKPGQLTRDHPSVRRVASVRQQFAPGEPVNEGAEGLSSEP